MTQTEKEEFVRKIQNNTQPKKINIKSMITQQKNLIKKDKTTKEKEKFENKIPDEIATIGIIHPNRKKMSSKKCLEKHQKKKALEAKTKKRVLENKLFIVKRKDVK